MGRPLACLLAAACRRRRRSPPTQPCFRAVLKTGVISQASGSAYAEFNNTKVLLQWGQHPLPRLRIAAVFSCNFPPE